MPRSGQVLTLVCCSFSRNDAVVLNVEEGEGDADHGEHEEMPEDLANLDPHIQQFHVKRRAAWLMFAGTALVLIFAGESMLG